MLEKSRRGTPLLGLVALDLIFNGWVEVSQVRDGENAPGREEQVQRPRGMRVPCWELWVVRFG